jgi:tetratricopeptide (TPR) repeat protein
MAVSLPIFVFVWSFCENWGELSGSWWRRSLKAVRAAFGRDKWLYTVLVAAGAAYGWYMIFVKGGSTLARDGGFVYWGGSIYTNFLTVVCVHAWYLKQLVFPTPVVQYLGAFDLGTTIWDGRVILSIVVVGVVLLSGFLMLKRDKLVSFAILSYFVLLLPVSQIVPHHELLADHYLYLPMMSFGLLVALVVRRIASRGRRYQRAAYGVASAALIALAGLTIFRNMDWKDDFTLWQANYREAPNSIRAAGNLAGMYTNRNPGKAIELYKRCLELDPSYSGAYLGLASLMQTRDEAEKLETLILKALAMPQTEISTPAQQYYRSSRSQLTIALALTKYNQGQQSEAEQLLWSVIQTNPGEADPYKILADIYRENNPQKELEVLRKQAEANPLNLQALNNLSRRLLLENNYDEALPYLERTIVIDPNDFSANCHLGQIYQKKNDCRKARAYLSIARSAAIKPEQSKMIDDLDAGLEHQCGRQ